LDEAQTNNEEPANLVVMKDGDVHVRRLSRTHDTAVVFGTGLRVGDLLTVGEASHAKVVCSDLTLHDIPMGVGATPCSPSPVVLRYQDVSLIHVTRATHRWPNDGSSPIVLSPRKTKLLSPHPTLRWTAVKGVTNYHVFIRGLHVSWESSAASTQINYPNDAPKLEPGADYKMAVVTNDGSISDEPGLGLGFSVLEGKDVQIVLQQQHQIEDLHLADGPTQFLIAHVYASHGLYAEAIDRLQGVFPTFRVAAVKRLQADLYMKVGLPRQAETEYLASLDLSKSENDSECQMLEHKALAYIYEQIIGNREAACQQLKETLDLARTLGDDFTASQAEKRLAELKAAVAKFKAAEPKTESVVGGQLAH